MTANLFIDLDLIEINIQITVCSTKKNPYNYRPTVDPALDLDSRLLCFYELWSGPTRIKSSRWQSESIYRSRSRSRSNVILNS